MREERPQVAVTYGERGGYGHPDHVRSYQVAVAAFEATGDDARFPSAGPAWAPSKLYYSVFRRSAMRRFGERRDARGQRGPAVRRGRRASDHDRGCFSLHRRQTHGATSLRRGRLGPDAVARTPVSGMKQAWRLTAVEMLCFTGKNEQTHFDSAEST